MNRLFLSMFVVLVLTVSLAPALGADSTADQNKALVGQFYEEIFNSGKVEQIEKYIAADGIDHEVAPGKTDPQPCRENLKDYLSVFRKAFPDLKVKVQDDRGGRQSGGALHAERHAQRRILGYAANRQDVHHPDHRHYPL